MSMATKICLECDQSAVRTGLCRAHYERKLRRRNSHFGKRQPKPRSNVCKNGHIIDADNSIQRGKYVRCKTCQRGYRQKNSASDSIAAARRYYYRHLALVLAEREDVATADDEKPTAPWNLLRPKPLAREAWAAFSEALNRTKPSCHREPGKFTDYADEGEEPEDGQQPFPTSIQAAQMCSGCPLVQLCRDYARLDQPVTGVWAGEVWVQDEKLAYRGKRRYG